MKKVDLAITGMHCAACARHIEQKLSATTGVQQASVNFATSRATVTYNPDVASLHNLMDAVKDAGYETTGLARASFIVDDSARPSGSATPLEQSIKRLPGVVGAVFNLSLMEIHVDYLAGMIDARSIRNAIEQVGHRVREVPNKSDALAEDWELKAREDEYRDLNRKFWVAAVLSIPVLAIAMSHGRISFLNFRGVEWLQLALTTPVVFYSGRQFYRGAWAAFRHRLADMNTLIARHGDGLRLFGSGYDRAGFLRGRRSPRNAGHA